MNNNSYQPLVDVATREEAQPGTIGAALTAPYLPEIKNYANDEKVSAYVRGDLAQAVTWTRLERQRLHEEWHEIRNMVLLNHDGGRRYFGRSDTYVPMYRKVRSTLVSALSRGLFPSDEYMDVWDRSTGDPEKSRPVKAYMQWELDNNAQFRRFVKPMFQQLVDYGTSPFKYWYRKELRTEGGVNRLLPSVSRGMEAEYGFKSRCVYEGLAVSPRNLFFWYVYPYSAESLDDAQMVFEDIDTSWAYLQQMKDNKRWMNVDEGASAWMEATHEEQQIRMLEARGFSDVPGRSLGKTFMQYTVTEVWCYMVLPPSAYLPFEDTRQPLPTRVVMTAGVPLLVTRNPFFHQRPPYLCSRIDWEPGCFYGNAQGRVIRPLQMLANDFANQTNDNGMLALNPLTIMNPNLMVGKPRPFAPGVVWYANEVEKAVKFDRPPFEQVGMGVQMLQLSLSLGQDFGGAPPVLQGVGAGRAAKTATGAQILQRNALAPLQDVVEDIEADVMVPMLRGAWKNSVQYREEDVMAFVAGESIRVTPESLAIDAEFKWLASSQAINSQTRSQQIMTLIQTIAPMLPAITAQGYIVDFVPLIRKVYVDGFGLRGFAEFIRKGQAAPNATPGQPVRPDQLAGVRAEQEDVFRSALESIAGGGQVEPEPGEAEDFAAIRNSVESPDAIAGGGLQ